MKHSPVAKGLDWPALTAGDRICVVAPAGPFDHDAFEAGVTQLRSRYQVRVAADITARTGYLAGDDARRAGELSSALGDPACRAIVAVRGGYGCTRLLPHVDFAQLKTNPKLLVGFSDVTALHAQWQRLGIGSLHGTMVAKLGNATPRHRARLFDAFEGTFTPEIVGLSTLRSGHGRGPLFGGNLAVLGSLLGTPFAPSFDGGVLFIEDTGERPYRVDRLLTTLHLGGYLNRLAGVLVGAFTDCRPGPDGTTIDTVLQERLGQLSCPVLLGVPSGHVTDNLELPLGRLVEVDGGGGRVGLLD